MEVGPSCFPECGLVEEVILFFGGLVFAFAFFGRAGGGGSCVGYGCVWVCGAMRVCRRDRVCFGGRGGRRSRLSNYRRHVEGRVSVRAIVWVRSV